MSKHQIDYGPLTITYGDPDPDTGWILQSGWEEGSPLYYHPAVPCPATWSRRLGLQITSEGAGAVPGTAPGDPGAPVTLVEAVRFAGRVHGVPAVGR